MQRRRTSADIVNPSTSERILTTACHDSSNPSHESAVLNSSINPTGASHAVLDQGYVSSTVRGHRGYVCHSIDPTDIHATIPQHVQLSALDLAGNPPPAVYNAIGDVASLRLGKDARGPSDVRVHGELSLDNQDDCQGSLPKHQGSWSSGHPSSSYGPSSSSDHDASSLLTAPSSAELFGADSTLTNSAGDVCAIQSLPILCKESVKLYTYVDSLVDTATIITHALWPYAETTASRQVSLNPKVLGHFITETLRKSKTSWSTMQLALLYCIRFRRDQNALARALLEKAVAQKQSLETVRACLGSMCARRNFLSALVLASKYLQDRNFSNKAWSKISTVPIAEINLREREFLEISQWRLDIKHDVFKHWSSMMETFITEIRDNTIFGDLDLCQNKWKFVLQRMVVSTDLDMTSVMAQTNSMDILPGEAQLVTPASTPGAETDSLYVADVPACDLVSAAENDLPSPCTTAADMEEVNPCPFFDEFVHASPRQQSDAGTEVDEHDRASGATAYATPQSFSLATPQDLGKFFDNSSIEQEAHCKESVLSLESPSAGESGGMLTPESVASEESFSVSSSQSCPPSRGVKRAITQVYGSCDEHSVQKHGKDTRMKVRKVDRAFSRST